MADGVAQVVEHLPGKHQALSSNSSATGEKNKSKNKNRPLRPSYVLIYSRMCLFKVLFLCGLALNSDVVEAKLLCAEAACLHNCGVFLPVDHTRVVLHDGDPNEPVSDYINANIIMVNLPFSGFSCCAFLASFCI
jgi:hypothetical protein